MKNNNILEPNITNTSLGLLILFESSKWHKSHIKDSWEPFKNKLLETHP